MEALSRYRLYLWLATGTLGALLGLYELSATLVNGEFIPADQDSFYHARRILDSIAHPTEMYQFDPRIHSPEGSWITWPWAYDMLLAGIGHVYVSLTGSSEPLSFLSFIAPAWMFVNMALMLGIVTDLSLVFPLQILAMLFSALLPLNRGLHRVGMLDHHYMEYTFVLATVYLGLRLFKDGQSATKAATLGLVLGMAPAFHNGLFILQLPVLATVLLLWWLNRPLPRSTVRAFSGSLVTTTLVFLLPSEPFRRGMFDFYLHSWFHLYVSVATAGLAVLATYQKRRLLGAAIVLGAIVILLVPLVSQIHAGGSWVSGQMTELRDIFEVESPWHAMLRGRAEWIGGIYSYMIFFLPMTLVYLSVRLRSRHAPADIFFFVFVLFGILLLSNQIRLQYFGSFALVLPWCIYANERLQKSGLRRIYLSIFGLMLGLSLVPGYRHLLRNKTPPATDFQFSYSIDLFKVLRSACAKTPGLVLADQNDGHIITYYSDCSVIANNFIMTPQHERKIQESRKLLASTSQEALLQRPDIRYILIRRGDPVLYTRKETCGADCPENHGLAAELLFDRGQKNPDLKLLAESRITVEGSPIPFARLFEVVRNSEFEKDRAGP